MGLFELSAQIRKIIALVGLFLLAIIILFILWISLRFVVRLIFPPESSTPIASFGKLSKPDLPKSKVILKTTVFNLDLPEGGLPNLPGELKVYPIPRPVGTLSSLDVANKQAHSFGFDNAPKKLSEVKYLWTDPKRKAKTLTMDIVSGYLLYKYDPTIDPSILKGTFKFTNQEAIKEARRFLKRVRSFPDDLEDGEAKINFYKQKGEKRSAVTSFSEANAVEILFFRKPLEGKYPLVLSNTNTSLVRVVLGANKSREGGIVEAEFIYWTVDFDNASIYPLKSADDAWQQFQDGGASFVKGDLESFDEIFLGNIYLAYLETNAYQTHLQPILVFTGSGAAKNILQEFIAYLPALADEFLEESSEEEAKD